MPSRYGRYLPALGGLAALLLVAAAPVVPASQPQGKPQAAPSAPQPNSSGGESLTRYERESLAVDRAANRLAQASNSVAEAQREYAFWQLILASFGVGFTGVAAFWAWRATHWAKTAASAAQESARADNEALKATREAAEEARKEAVEQAKRVGEQLRLMGETMQHTADSAAAMKESAKAAARQVAVAEETAQRQLRAYLYPEVLNMIWSDEGHPLFDLTLHNAGKTPALNVCAAAVGEFHGLTDTPALDRHIYLAKEPVVGAGRTREITLYVHKVDEVRRHHISRDNVLYVLGRLQYSDVFGNRYQSDFSYYTTQPKVPESGLMPTAANARSYVETVLPAEDKGEAD